MQAQFQATIRRIPFLLLTVLVATVPVAGAAPAAAQDESLPILSLQECIDLALQDSPTLLIAGERQNIAAQGVRGAYGNFLPNLSLSHSRTSYERTDYDVPITYTEVDTSTFITMTDNQGNDWYTYPVSSMVSLPSNQDVTQPRATNKSWSGRADWTVFSGFSRLYDLQSARRDRDAAEATFGYTRELVVEDVVTAYFNLLRYRELRVVAVETRDQAAKELERIETYFRLGSAAKSDVLQQKVRLENTRLDLVIAENNVKKAFADLAYAMNQPLAELFRIDDSVLQTDYEVEDLELLYEQALVSRLDLRSQQLSTEARNKDVGSARSSLYPSLSLFANVSRSDSDSDEKWSLTQTSSSNSYGYSVSWNVFDRLQTWTGISRAKANARIAEYELEQARMNVQVEIRQLHNSLVEARERANVSRETIGQSAEELRLAQERFRVGAGTTLDVITAQVNLASARAQEVQAKCDFLIAQAQLDRAAGRLTAVASGQ